MTRLSLGRDRPASDAHSSLTGFMPASPTMTLRRDAFPALPVNARLPRAPRLRTSFSPCLVACKNSYPLLKENYERNYIYSTYNRLGTLNTVLALLAVVPGAGAAIAPVQAAITSIMSALSILNGLPAVR
ncbi:hypothetical protein [Rickettsiella endosymbiont of Xylota segnis]|uniref:hypothetical protein n=1 Tax=Rickettsiella endosymbiont of Xylota segnis TaxID=3066238 RepID=UPI0030CE0AB8